MCSKLHVALKDIDQGEEVELLRGKNQKNSIMSEDQEQIDLCECVFSHEFAMRRLLNLVSFSI